MQIVYEWPTFVFLLRLYIYDTNKLLFSFSGSSVYRYYYNHQSSVDPWPTWSGSKHGDEIEYTFGVPLKMPKLYSAQEIKFSR